ncbi:4849_t:CDS:2, partial [Acaulospora colombiana]
ALVPHPVDSTLLNINEIPDTGISYMLPANWNRIGGHATDQFPALQKGWCKSREVVALEPILRACACQFNLDMQGNTISNAIETNDYTPTRGGESPAYAVQNVAPAFSPSPFTMNDTSHHCLSTSEHNITFSSSQQYSKVPDSYDLLGPRGAPPHQTLSEANEPVLSPTLSTIIGPPVSPK